MYKKMLRCRTTTLALKSATKSDQDGLKSRRDRDTALEAIGSGGLGPQTQGETVMPINDNRKGPGPPRAARRPSMDAREAKVSPSTPSWDREARRW